MHITQPIFIVSSGRSGTQMMHKLISGSDQVEIHHEYLCNIIQPLAVKSFMKLIPQHEIDKAICQSYGAAVHYSRKPIWIDSSNKASWLIPSLYSIFPNAKFIHLIRDGRRVVSSYYNKLNHECYVPDAVKSLSDFVLKKTKVQPPPEKKYWWPIINNSRKEHLDFLKKSQFEQIVMHWKIINKKIQTSLEKIPIEQRHFVKLEELTESQKTFDKLLGFIGINLPKVSFSSLRRPHNVHIPYNFPLNNTQKRTFWNLAGDVMDYYGYQKNADYEVVY